MQTTDLTLKSLHLMSPGLADDFEQQLRAAVTNCQQRPSLANERKVTITIGLKPHPEDPDDVLIQPVTTSKTPARKIDTIRARRARNNQLQFDFLEESM